MKTIPLKELEYRVERYAEVRQVLEAGELVCLPVNGNYRLVADLTNEGAVNRLLQSKRRTGGAPSLVFVEDQNMLAQVAAEIDPLAKKLAGTMWPGPLTILFSAHPDLPAGVVRQLCRANGKIGVRVPDDIVARRVVGLFGRPLLVSSANKEKKSGSGSPAQVRKNFIGRVQLFVDAGDLQPGPASTVVDVVNGRAEITRPGSVSAEKLAALTA